MIQIYQGKPQTTSLQIANDFDKEHKHVLDAIRKLAAENSATKSMFSESTHSNRGKEYPMFYIDRDGFSLLVMSFTGDKALEWKLKYIKLFNDMEERLVRPMTTEQLVVEAARTLDDHEKRISSIEERMPDQCKSIAAYAIKKKISISFKQASVLGKKCKALSKAKGLPIASVPHPLYNEVGCYREEVLEEVFKQYYNL